MKIMQNRGLKIPSGTVQCKLQPKTILQGSPRILIQCHVMGETPVLKEGHLVLKKGQPDPSSIHFLFKLGPKFA